MPNRKKHCALCLRPFGRGRTAPRVTCTTVSGGEDYRFTHFHAGCMARNPQLAVLAVVGSALERQRAKARRRYHGRKGTYAAEHTKA